MFDTLAYARKLKDSGVPERQAELQAEALREALETNLAAKQEITDVRHEVERLRHEVERQGAALQTDVTRLEERTKGRFTLLQWMLGFNLALTLAVFWLLIRGSI